MAEKQTKQPTTRPKNHYRICESILEFEVENQVNELMEQGWKPLGNLLVITKIDASNEEQYIHFVQAMVKS